VFVVVARWSMNLFVILLPSEFFILLWMIINILVKFSQKLNLLLIHEYLKTHEHIVSPTYMVGVHARWRDLCRRCGRMVKWNPCGKICEASDNRKNEKYGGARWDRSISQMHHKIFPFLYLMSWNSGFLLLHVQSYTISAIYNNPKNPFWKQWFN
jgi:hypothetical protein